MSEYVKPADYKAIELWGEHLGSRPYYIKSAQSQASTDHAPVDSIYKCSTLGRWIYIRDLDANHPVRKQYEELT